MPFYFTILNKNQFKKKLSGHLESIVLSLQLIKPATITNNSNNRFLGNVSPASVKKHHFYICKVKRAFLSPFLSGSITVECSLVFPIFLFSLAALLYFFNILYIQLSLQIQLDETARLINKYTYSINDIMSDTSENSENLKKLFEDITLSGGAAVLAGELFFDEDISSFINNTLIIDGVDGISFFATTASSNTQIYDLFINYKIRLPFISEEHFCVKLLQRCRFRAFTGLALNSNIDLNIRYVYKTKASEIFHENRNCSYLERYSEVLNLESLKQKYPYMKLCSFCGSDNKFTGLDLPLTSDYVFVTSEHDVYHTSEICPVFSRNLLRIPYDDAVNIYEPCLRCIAYTKK